MKRQRGATLLVALIMLVLMMLAAVMSFKAGRTNTLVVGNQQARQVTTETARAALEEVASRALFAESPAAVFGNSNVKNYDINGDGTADVKVELKPQPCIKNYTKVDVDLNDSTSYGCVGGAQQNFGVEGGAAWGTTCADVIWEVAAVATDAVTETSSTVAQGIRIRQDANAAVDAANYCP